MTNVTFCSLCYNDNMNLNEDANRVVLGVGILVAIVILYAVYRVATSGSRGSALYRTDAQARRANAWKNFLMVLVAVVTFGLIVWLLMAF